MDRPIGLIAGAGNLPVLTAENIRASGRRVACVGFHGMFDPRLPGLCDYFAPAGFVQLGKWIRLLRRQRVDEAVMVGRVDKVRMYDPFVVARHCSDWRALKIWLVTNRHDRRTGALLQTLANELARGGIHLIDSTRYIPDHVAEEGVMTHCRPTAVQLGDVQFGLSIAQRLSDLDIGQSIAVKNREVIAVEAVDGTDAMIRRAGEICRAGSWTMIKIAKPSHDMRLDVPAVGLKTIENLRAARGACLAVSAGRTIVLDKAAFLNAADDAGIAVVGVALPGTVGGAASAPTPALAGLPA